MCTHWKNTIPVFPALKLLLALKARIIYKEITIYSH